MGISYQAVGWNRQKRRYDTILLGFCIAYIGTFVGLSLVFNREMTFETLLIRSTSTLALLLLHVILSIGPLCRLDNRFLPLLYNRRHLGVTMFTIAAIHGGFSIFQFHGLGNVNPLLSLFLSNTRYDSLSAFPFQALGFFALLIFLLMAVTSHDFWLHMLSPRTWKTLHMAVYAAYLLVILHVVLGVIQYETNPVFILILFGGTSILITLHLLAGYREVRKDNLHFPEAPNASPQFPEAQKRLVQVCAVSDIAPDRAKVFCIDKERIAVFRSGDILHAIHNVCKHQNGPLGEGKVIDGCITCPWHGYQYLPKNGQSPPPFTEKVSTYDVEVIDGMVWLDPKPYPEGTERPGAPVNQQQNKA
ncbi:MAG TPA: Rieske 2Fe-2S domain-containing protein [Puia sp.]|uniref:Rieske 2Fe-2S domain-containing protein n=1 Tax=Puia sp. TaxID=2045100 RepID=UPI002CA1D935|nr:Rieske 2Fe-2S domain-containing protein [Puia sp.]HVU94435.1 Rieske 2Fe-2S domain-containing protein [Puia sp.]